jgi:hypothetical protein
MFRRGKPQRPPKPRSSAQVSGVYPRPSFNEDQTDTLKILLGETDLALEEDSEAGCDPHDNTARHSVKHLRSKL